MLKGRFLSAKRSVSFEATQNKHCTWKGCEFAKKFHKIGIFCRPFWLLRERKKFRVTRTGILRQLRWLRVASTIVLTTGQNQRYIYRCHAYAWNCRAVLRRRCRLRATAHFLLAAPKAAMLRIAAIWRWQDACGRTRWVRSMYGARKNPRHRMMSGIFGDPYGNRTHITAVKGRCLNLLTNGPGSGNLTRTDDTPGMNRMLYQLSYAAIMIACRISRAGCIIKDSGDFVNRILKYFQKIFCIVPPAGTY